MDFVTLGDFLLSFDVFLNFYNDKVLFLKIRKIKNQNKALFFFKKKIRKMYCKVFLCLTSGHAGSWFPDQRLNHAPALEMWSLN